MGPIEDFAASCAEMGLSPASDVLVALSGGPDSVYLAEMARMYFHHLFLGYIDYHDSPATPEEERIVSLTVQRLKGKFLRFDCSLDYRTSDFESRARHIRYRQFSQWCQEFGLAGVLVGHQRNDDAETYLLQSARGGIFSYPGLKPISEVDGVTIFRPMLGVSKREIQEYLRVRKIPFFDDPTNRNMERKRDFLRFNVLLDDGDVDRVLARRDAELPIFLATEKRIVDFAAKDQQDLNSYRRLSSKEQRMLICRYLDFIYPDFAHERVIGMTEEVYLWLKGERLGELKLDAGYSIFKDRSKFFFAASLPPFESYRYLIEGAGEYHFPEVDVHLDQGSRFRYPLVIKNIGPDDLLERDGRIYRAYSYLKSHHVPVFIRDRYPGVFDTEGKLIYIPSWDRRNKESIVVVVPDPIAVDK